MQSAVSEKRAELLSVARRKRQGFLYNFLCQRFFANPLASTLVARIQSFSSLAVKLENAERLLDVVCTEAKRCPFAGLAALKS